MAYLGVSLFVFRARKRACNSMKHKDGTPLGCDILTMQQPESLRGCGKGSLLQKCNTTSHSNLNKTNPGQGREREEDTSEC